ncbi:hypothetical protein DKX38_004813 [Salix brachista]|uniref:Palmitoyltransferase n=1 Tax=Salix brachista TaxID=2182728 RepID=A0A5N5NBV3_9ROSI|nr:hypothetical protein DKX38_004813 [Salix brachista]
MSTSQICNEKPHNSSLLPLPLSSFYGKKLLISHSKLRTLALQCNNPSTTVIVLSTLPTKFGKAVINPWISLSIVNKEIRRYSAWGVDLYLVQMSETDIQLSQSYANLAKNNDYQPNMKHAISTSFVAHAVIILLFLTSARDPGIIPRNLHPPEDEGSSISVDWSNTAKHACCTAHPDALIALYATTALSVLIIIARGWGNVLASTHPMATEYTAIRNVMCIVHGKCIHSYALIMKIMDTYHCNMWTAFLKSPVSGILILYTFICAWFVGGLTAFHLYLIFTNQTTYENFRYRYDGKMNPYNLGCIHNVLQVFFSKIPKSKNKFRAKVRVNSSSSYASSMPLGDSLSPEVPKRSFDIEVGKRQAVADEDFEAIQSQIDSVGGLERCGTQPRHTNWDHKANWEITPDIHVLAAEFGMESGLADRQKISGDH